MAPHNEAAAPMGSIIGNGGLVVSKAVTAQNYLNLPICTTASPTDLAVAVLISRHGLTPTFALVIAELAGIGDHRRAAS